MQYTDENKMADLLILMDFRRASNAMVWGSKLRAKAGVEIR